MGPLPEEVLRARRTAAVARVCLAVLAIVILISEDQFSSSVLIRVIGFTIIILTAGVALSAPGSHWLKLEESLAATAATLIIGLGPERVTVVSILWLAAVASGVIARGGRVHWVGRTVLLISLALPIVREQKLTLDYLGLVVAVLALLLTCGRVTRELRDMLERARNDADHDGLTGALSRSAFRARLDRIAGSLEERENVALLLLDLDNFGSINKASGHLAGDRVLASLVTRVQLRLDAQCVIGRLGGDEFGIVVSHLDPPGLAQEMLDDLACAHDDVPPLSASIGIALLARDGHDAETLLRSADVALRVAKRSGKHQLSLYAGEPMTEQGPGGAREALQRLIDGEGLTLVVQPIVAMSNGRPHAYEVLARFQTRGTSSPLHWFAVADEYGLRDELELACLREALQLLSIRPEGTRLSINLSGPLLLDPRTHALLGELASLDGLILELTENSLLEDTPGLHAQISGLLRRGVRFAVDDMGAGYSGLRQITTLRPSYLKLDRTLICAIDSDPDRGALVSALLSYARQTGGHLVAEGVETADELRTLTQLGVELVQGFYLARPGWPWPEVEAVEELSGRRDLIGSRRGPGRGSPPPAATLRDAQA
jgi:diguanylate cyclase (GGDEF)-like protein